MGTRRPPLRGRRRDSIALAGGQRYHDPDRSGTRVAVLRDRDRINIDETHEVRDWAKSLGVSEDELRSAVAKAGPMVKDVKAHLQRG
jgi:Protein of unknown function (DUF3606)